MRRLVVDGFVDRNARRGRARRVVIAKCLKSTLASWYPEGESRENLAQAIDANPDICVPGTTLQFLRPTSLSST
jgi:hypothetical protein